MIAAAIVFALNAAIVKQLGQTGIDSLQTVFVRSIMGLLLPLPFIWHAGWSTLSTKQPLVQGMQGVAGTAALMAHFYAWTQLPLATVTALIFTQPLFVLIFAVLLLGAWVRLRRWLATCAGFIGVLVMVRPGMAEFNPAALFALFAGFGIAVQLVLIARLPKGENQLAMLFYLGMVGTLITAGPGLMVWQAPSETQAFLLVVNGILGVGHQACIFRAYRVGDAAYVAPFDYSKLVAAGLFGFVFFSEIPDAWTVAGATLIVASTSYIAHHERHLAHRK